MLLFTFINFFSSAFFLPLAFVNKHLEISVSMKRLLTILLVLTSISLHAQVLNPVHWTFTSNRLSNNEMELIFTANIDEGWHVYGMNLEEGGPVPTSIHINEGSSFQLVDNATEVSIPDKKFDSSFGMEIPMHSNKAVFKQKIKITQPGTFNVTGYVEYMSCDDSRCLPPKEEDFTFRIKGNKAVAEQTSQTESKADITETTDASSSLIKKAPLQIDSKKDTRALEQARIESSGLSADAAREKQGKSLWVFFFISFLAGLAGMLTPCVFPMIPMTVSFFMRGSENRRKAIMKGIVFGLSIVVIYSAIGVIVSLTSAGADFATQLSSHWIPNTIFFLLFILFAASFFGMFELVLPNTLVEKADKRADKGGMLGAFFMALTLVIVSFSCTGPIIGALLVESASGGLALKPAIGMFGFSLAFALPFTLFAIFPSWLSNLPKSGGWLNSVKVVLGFIVLAFSFKFLGNMSQAYHLGIMGRSLYLSIWIVIFILLGMYLLGKIKFAHDSDTPHVGFPRLILAVASFTFSVYLFPGLFGAPLTEISALIPPKTSQSFDLERLIEENQGISSGEKSNDQSATFCGDARFSDILTLPYGLKGYFDYHQALACAKKLNKPVFLDFNGHGCSNCKDMEAKVWPNPGVLERLRNDFVIVALYVDDRTKLPEDEWVTSTFDGKVKKTMGKKNADFQITRFNTNTQPFYVILDPDGKKLAGPYGLDTNPDHFIQFLDKGKAEFLDEQ